MEPSSGSVVDAALLRRIAAGEAQALRELFDRYAPAATALAYRITGDPMLAEDVVQEAFLHVWTRPHSYNPDRGTARVFLFTIVHHRAVDRIRAETAHRRRDQAQVRMAEPPAVPVDELAVEAVEIQRDRKRINEALAGLSAEQRQVIEMMYFNGMSQTQIAQQLDQPLGTVKSRTLVAMRRLKVALAPDRQDPR